MALNINGKSASSIHPIAFIFSLPFKPRCKKMKYILAIMLAAILLFGCAQQGGGTQTGTGGTAGDAAGGAAGGATGGTTGGTAGTGGATGAENGTAGGATGGATGGASGTGGTIDLTSWSMETLAAMGTPVHCTVTYSGTMAGTYDIYILGQRSAMTGTFATATGNQDISYVFKDNKIYMPASLYASIPGFEGCDWVSRSTTATTSVQESTVSVETAPESFSCTPDVFGDEKFATAGTECDFSTTMAAVCDPIPAGAARDQCLANLGIQ